jgi:hypothetical protein
MPDTLAWTSVSLPGGSSESTQAALEELDRISAQYERYLELARINELPSLLELGDPTPYEAPHGDRPLGLVIDVTTPMGFRLTKQT